MTKFSLSRQPKQFFWSNWSNLCRTGPEPRVSNAEQVLSLEEKTLVPQILRNRPHPLGVPPSASGLTLAEKAVPCVLADPSGSFLLPRFFQRVSCSAPCRCRCCRFGSCRWERQSGWVWGEEQESVPSLNAGFDQRQQNAPPAGRVCLQRALPDLQAE